MMVQTNPAPSSWFSRSVVLFFFATIFAYFTRALTAITDFWWHLSTGRWIWENGQLPSQDPFLFTTPPTVDLKQALILKGYWLAQLSYYLLSTLPQNWWVLILFKASLFTLIFFVVYRYLRKAGVESNSILILLGMLLLLGKGYDEIRPQVFTFLGVVLLIALLDHGLPAARTNGTIIPRLLWIPLLMVIWGNMHPGFIIGSGILLCYAIAEMLATLRDPAVSPNGRGWTLPGFLAGSALCGMLNPTPGHAFVLTFRELLLRQNSSSATISEYRPPLQFLASHGEAYQPYLFVLLTVILATITVAAWKRLPLAHKLVLPILLIFGCLSFRYTFIALSAGIMMAGRQLPSYNFPTIPLIRPFQTVIVFTLMAAVWLVVAESSAFGRRPLLTFDADGPAEFLKSRKPDPPLFNPYEWGGYLTWTLGSEFHLFTDARTLDYPTYQDYRSAISGMIDTPFRKHGIKTVIFRLREPSTQKTEIPLIIFALLRDDQWELAYADSYATVFLKKSTSPLVPRLDKGRFIAALDAYFLNQVKSTPNDADLWVILGELNYARGDVSQARTCFNRALALKPDHPRARAWMESLR